MIKIIIYLLLLLAVACAGGTSTGNPMRITIQSSTFDDPNNKRGVSLASSFYGNSFTSQAFNRDAQSTSEQAKANLDFKICVVEVAFLNSNDERFEITIDDLGLIDLSNPDQTKIWGQIEVDPNNRIEFDTIVIGIDADPGLCGQSYSIRYEGQEVTTDFELFFEYDPEDFNTDYGDLYRLDVEVFAEAAESAIDDSEFNNTDWPDYVDDFIGSFEEDDDFIDDEDVFGD